ncbi:MAG: hypothetical protein AAF447_18795, partial [Myxococcota bacterium]
MHTDTKGPTPSRETVSSTSRTLGLEGIVAAETRLSSVDGAAGKLVIAAHHVEALVREVTFPGACALLLGRDAGEVATQLGCARAAASGRLGDLGLALDRPDPMDALAAALAQLRPKCSGEGSAGEGGAGEAGGGEG